MTSAVNPDEQADAWFEAAEAAAQAIQNKIIRHHPDLVQRIKDIPFEDIPAIGVVPEGKALNQLTRDLQLRFGLLEWLAHGRPESEEELIRTMADLAGVVYLVVDFYHPDKCTL